MTYWDGYFSLAGVEFANEERFRTYIQNVGPHLPFKERDLGAYSGLATALGDAPYSNPVDDRAPWVDLDEPITHGFLGATLLTAEGIDDSATVAGVTESLGKGGTVGVPRDASREMRFTFLLAGLTPEAVQAGVTWLHRVLWQSGNPRPLVPQLPGISDFRFFEQRPDSITYPVNRVSNPDATGLGESLIGTSGTAYAFRSLDEAGNWAYKITARRTAVAEAQLLPVERALAVPGQQWVARADIWRASAITGTRIIRLYLRFRDQYGNIIDSIGRDDTTVPTGVLYRWTGGRYDSISQMLTPSGMVQNFIVNPSAEGTTLGLSTGGRSVVRLTATTAMTGKKAYMVTSGAEGTAATVSRLAPVEAGQQWWGRAMGRLTNATGARHMRADLSFLNRAGQEIQRSAGAVVDLVPSGIFRRWRGTPGRSSSEEFTGNTRRINYSTNPSFAVDAGAVSGRNATIAREKTTALGEGSTYALRVTPSNTNDVVTGVTLSMNCPKGSTIYVTFVVMASNGPIQMRLTGAGWAAASGDANDLLFTATTTPTRVTIPIKVTGNPEDQILRLARVANTNMRSFRVTNIGLIDGAGAYFNGATASTGPQFVSSVFNLSVGGIAPDDATHVRLVLSSLGTGPTAKDDQYLFDQVMLAQQDAPVDTDPTDTVEPVATLPAYFDGDSPTTYESIPATVLTTTNANVSNAVVTAEAPVGAVTAELAIERSDNGAGLVGDVVYADNLFLSPYDEGSTPPSYTATTRQDAIAGAERAFQEVFPVAGPTIIEQWEFGTDGCDGAAAQVEFTLVAQNPTRLRDKGDVVPLPLPTSVVQGNLGNGSFAKIEDRVGVVKNYMPQFSISSPIIPSSWVTVNTNGSIEVKGVQPNSYDPYVLYVRVGPTGTNWTTTISAISVLGDRGGYDSATASIWIGASAARSVTVKMTTYNGQSSVAAYTKTVTVPATSDGSILSDAFRVDFTLPGAGSGVDGFRFTITGPTDPVITYIGNPQVTLGSTIFPLINGNLPDDGTYTYGFDGAGFSYRKPVSAVESHTIFANLTAPPTPQATLAGYDEVGLTTYRTYAAIPAEVVPRNASAVPVLRADFDAFITRWVRFRFYPNPRNLSPEKIDTSTYEFEWVIDMSYAHIAQYNAVGKGYTSIVIDGVARRVWMRAWDGTVIPGDQYILTSEGTPIQWPEFRDIPWVVSAEYPTFRQGNEPTGETWWRMSLGLMIEE